MQGRSFETFSFKEEEKTPTRLDIEVNKVKRVPFKGKEEYKRGQ